MDTALRQDIFVWHSKTQIKYGNRIPFWGLHGFGNTHRRCIHTSMIDGKTV
ncbi:Uncharacterised protein [Vibrio cholerae]|nr:Uncharacterised protein [Vibrio cholerae]